MKKVTFLLLFTFFYALTSSANEARIVITTKHIEKASKYELRLKEDQGRILCLAPEIPSHYIEVTALKTMTPPFKSDRPDSGCKKLVQWTELTAKGKRMKRSETCYKHGKIPVLDDVIQWCTSL